MDVLNFISWLKSKRQVTTVDASQTLIPVGLKDARRKDGYLPGAISVEDLLAGATPPVLPNDNTAYGEFALAALDGGINNSAFGYNALGQNTTGESNTAVGYEALRFNSTGIYNTFVGISAGTGITIGSGNVGLGWSTLSGGPNGTGQNNIGIGQLAGENVGAANFSIAIGSGTQINGHSCSIVLGQNAKATASNQLVIGSQFAGENIGTIATEALTPTISWAVRINGVNYKIPLQVA
jgi:hypothetical protein